MKAPNRRTLGQVPTETGLAPVFAFLEPPDVDTLLDDDLSVTAVATEQSSFIEAVKEAIASALDERSRVDAETHRMHHEYVRDLIECSRRRRDIFDAVIKYVTGIALVGAIGFIGAAVLRALGINIIH